MERAISPEERIKRAEEIYNRRKMQSGIRVSTSNVNTKSKVEYSLFKKLVLQILICLVIYFIFYLIRNSNYIFSEDVINKTKNFLSYDINFQQVYVELENYYNNNIKTILKSNNNESNIEENNIEENLEKSNEENVQGSLNVSVEEVGIGGGEEGSDLLENEIVKDVSADEENKVELSQMEIDANEIKKNYNLIRPLKGTVSSRFGPRTPTNIISANHAGIDIAANEGTVFISSMEGKVTCVATEGGYGNHIYIQNNDVITLYAHCKSIYLKEGESVSQGQKIGEVGSTGNATGPHLHFEIRKSDRVVNPEYILTF
ncbi:MAG: M23 family metallopeptidase [Clostridiaceae bacterium]|nr:M23 family metallopeptidase [Clostridiaceae bacterium]